MRGGSGTRFARLANVFPLKRPPVLYTLIVILLVLWLLGVLMSFTLGGLIHALVVLAVVLLVVNVLTGRKPPTPPL